MSTELPRMGSSVACANCAGTGKIRYSTPGGDSITWNDGTVITDLGTTGTRACECVASLPAIDGKATWWESESVYSTTVEVPIGCEQIEVTAECEIPRNEDGRRVHRNAENAYYPPLVEIVTPEKVTLRAQDVRVLADALIAAADACDKADELAIATQRGSR